MKNQYLVLIFKIFSGVALTLIITQSYLFKPLRDKIKNKHLNKLINCPMCLGFWVGLLVFFNPFLYLEIGLITSLFSYITYLVLKPLINKYD